MSELGQVLQKAREEKGISLDDIQKMTKIQIRYLEAIERGHFHILPGHFYARAFIKSYAEAVGLDPNNFLMHFQSDLPTQPPQEQIERLRRRRAAAVRTPMQAGRWVTQTLLALFIILVVGMIYVALVNRTESQPLPIPSEKISEKPEMQVNPSASTTTPTQGPVVVDKPEEPVAVPATIAFVSQQGRIYNYEVSSGDKLKIFIKATTDKCWLQVRESKNGKKIGEVTLQKGKEQTFEAAKTAYVVVGNPRAVEIVVNNAPVSMKDIKMIPANIDLKIKK